MKKISKFFIAFLILSIFVLPRISLAQTPVLKAETGDATDITGTSATLNAVVNTGGDLNANISFQYTDNPNFDVNSIYDKVDHYIVIQNTSSNGDISVSVDIPPIGQSPLAPGKTYHFRVRMMSSNGTFTLGQDNTFKTFTTINQPSIIGISAPVADTSPSTVLSGNEQYTGTISWNTIGDTFVSGISYTATITLAPTQGYTLEGIPANFFKVDGATTTNDANSGVVKAVFPVITSYYNLVDTNNSQNTATTTNSSGSGTTVTTDSKKLIPCGTVANNTPCDGANGWGFLMTLINNVVNFILFRLLVPIAAIMFVYAGFELLTAGGETSKLTKAKKIFTNVVIGLIIAVAAWLIVHAVLAIVGYTDATYFGF